jgi:RNA polymerase sigma-70 factor (ECF subfamily)
MSVLSGLRRLQDPGAFGGWAYRIVTFKCVDHVRRSERQRRAEEQQPAQATADPEDDEVMVLRAALADLSVEQRALLSLYYREELRVERIAEILGIPLGTVKSRLHHTRAVLKERMERRRV